MSFGGIFVFVKRNIMCKNMITGKMFFLYFFSKVLTGCVASTILCVIDKLPCKRE